MADLKTLLGDQFKEGMTIEEITAALADKTFVDPSTLPKSVTKDIFDKTASELAKAKKDFQKAIKLGCEETKVFKLLDKCN